MYQAHIADEGQEPESNLSIEMAGSSCIIFNIHPCLLNGLYTIYNFKFCKEN